MTREAPCLAALALQLNNEEVVRAISRHLSADPSFAELMSRMHPGLPPAARPILLEYGDSDVSSVAGAPCHRAVVATW